MLDLFSRRIVGWQTSHRIDRQLVCDTFNYAMARQGYPMGVMVHSDQGSQYCSRDFRALLLTNNCVQSMSRRGNCWDNAVTESFFHTLKGHVVHGSVFATRKEANTVLFDYIEIYYNRVRRHSANGWLSPEAFEQKYFKNLEDLLSTILSRIKPYLLGLEKCTADVISHKGLGGTLKLGVVPTFATRWLLPKLHLLNQKHPEITVHLETSTKPFYLTTIFLTLRFLQVRSSKLTIGPAYKHII